MIDRRHAIPKGEAWKGTFGLEPNQSSTKGISDQDVNKGGERTSLPNPTRGFEEFRGPAIDERGYPGRRDAGLNLIDENRGESKSFHHHENEGMPQSVEGISQVQLDGHPGLSSFSA